MMIKLSNYTTKIQLFSILENRNSTIHNFKNKSFALMLLFATMISGGNFVAAQTVTIGSGASTQGNFPNAYVYNYSYTQTIYTKAELIAGGADPAGGTITKIRYKPSASVSTTNWKDWVVYLGNTTKTGFTSTTNWVTLPNLTEVFNGTITSNVTAGN